MMRLHGNTDVPMVSIAVLATRDPALIRACLDSVFDTAASEVPTEVIVVLGAASPEVEAVVRGAEGVRVIESDVNTGTAAAGNLAFDAARAPYVFTVHEDTELLPGCLARLVETAEQTPRAGAIGTRVLNPDGSLQHLGAVLWASGELTPLVASTAPQLTDATHPFRVAVSAASAMFVRRSAWSEVGGFDERYFPFTYVDVDFSVALRAHGFDVLVEPRAATRHRRGASQAPGGGALATVKFRDWVYVRHRARLLEKWGAVVTDLPQRPEDVARTEVPAEEVAIALPPRGAEPVAHAPRADRPLTCGGAPAVAADGRVTSEVRRRLVEAEHTLLDAFAGDLAREHAGLVDEVASLWTALQDARAYNEGVYAELTSAGERVAQLVTENSAQAWELDAMREDLEALRSALAVLEAEVVGLRRRSEVYEQIVSGRWWRLRGFVYRLLGRQG